MNRSERIVRFARRHPGPFRLLLTCSRERLIPFRIYTHWVSQKIAKSLEFPPYHEYWIRTVMYKECFKLIAELDPGRLRVLEISPSTNRIWAKCGFKSIQYVDYPEFDICRDRLGETFDLIIADQVFEHLLWPYRAARNVHQMLAPEGYILVTTPFLVRIHASGDDIPYDCSRWTELGLKHLLSECGFPLERIKAGSWGNRRAIVGNFRAWVRQTWWRPMHNEPDFPVMVWALAQRHSTEDGPAGARLL